MDVLMIFIGSNQLSSRSIGKDDFFYLRTMVTAYSPWVCGILKQTCVLCTSSASGYLAPQLKGEKGVILK